MRVKNSTSTCEHCGVVFHPHASSNRRFCSQSCSRLAVQVDRSPRPCAGCQSLFSPTARDQTFCTYDCAMRSRITPPSARFWDKVNKSDGCWEWTGCQRAGYGRIWCSERKTKISAHRVSWELHYGIISDGLSVLHHCDNRLCVRPDHLFLGTLVDNNHDRDRKGRTSKGESRPGARLTVEDVRKIRELAAQGHRQNEIAALFAVSGSHISKVVTRKRWRHV